MVNRKCGSCKFFKSAGMAGSGWCEHPQRVELQNLVMVRKSELACRNGWDQDLWQPADEADEAVVAGPPPDSSAGVDQPYQYTAVTSERHDRTAHQPDAASSAARDEVTGIAVPSGHDQSSRSPRIPHNWPGNVRTNGSDQEQDRLLSSSATDDWRQRVAAAPKYDEQSQFSDSRWSRRDVDRGGPGFARVYGSRHAEQDNQQGTVPQPSEDAAPERDPDRSSGNLPAGTSTSSVSTAPTVHVDGPAPDRQATAQGADQVEQHTEPLPVDALNEQLAARSSNDAFSNGADPEKPNNGNGSGIACGTNPFVYVDGPELAGTAANHQSVSPSQQETTPVRDPIDERSRTASITRCCGTCRDFRRNSDGETGVCMNPYAFRDRPVVKCDQLACRSSVGVWWLPHDDVWLERADTVHHTRPTPHLDAALGLGANGGSAREARLNW